jgi:hypothetical protein
VELQDYANRWIAEQGESAASALFLDDASGIDTPERTTLGMQLALRLDQAAAQAKDPETVTAAEVMMDEVVDKLETMATSAGQGLRVFGMWSRMSPQGILRKAVQQIEKDQDARVLAKIGVSPSQATNIVNASGQEITEDNEILTLWNMMQADGPTARGRSIAATLRAIMPRARDWRRTIDENFALAGLRQQMTDSGGERLVRGFFQMLAPAREQPGPMASFDRATQELLSQTMREVAERAGIVPQNVSQQPDAVDRIVMAMSNDPLRMDKLAAAEAMMQEQLAERPELRAAWEEATAAMATQIAGPGLLRRTLRTALQGMRPDWAAAFNTGRPMVQAAAGIRQAAVGQVMQQVRGRLGPAQNQNPVMLPALEAELNAAFDEIATERFAAWQVQREQVAARARVAEARRRFLEIGRAHV